MSRNGKPDEVRTASLLAGAKEAIKTAMVIAFGTALHMGWEKPYWAGFAAAMLSLGTVAGSTALQERAHEQRPRHWFIFRKNLALY